MTMNKLSKNQRGFSLIEILISVLVFGIGIMGLGGLQVASLKGSSNAHYRTTASVLAQDLADRMKANITAVSTGNYGLAINCGVASDLCRRGNACTVDELAAFDLQEIMCGSLRGTEREGGVRGLLPGGNMTVVCPAGSCVTPVNTPRTTHLIRISWNTQKTDADTVNDDQARFLTMPIIP